METAYKKSFSYLSFFLGIDLYEALEGYNPHLVFFWLVIKKYADSIPEQAFT